MLKVFQWTVFSVRASFTMNLSFGDRPVNSPVSTARAPELVILACPSCNARWARSSGDKFQCAFPLVMPSSTRDEFTGFDPVASIGMISVNEGSNIGKKQFQSIALTNERLLFQLRHVIYMTI